MKDILPKQRRIILFFFHIWLIAAALVGAFLLRFDFFISTRDLQTMYRSILILVVVKMLVFWKAGVHRGWWRFVSLHDLVRILAINGIASVIGGVVLMIRFGATFPRSVYVLDFILCFLMAAGARFAVRLYNEAAVAEMFKRGRRRILIYGAGAAGRTLVREIRANPSLHYQVVGFLDDDLQKHNTTIMGVPVLGSGRQAARAADKAKRGLSPIDEIIIAMPSAQGVQMREALANCRAAGVPCKTVPGMSDMLTGKVLSAQIRNISVGDLLGREPVRLEENRIRDHIHGRSVLITGAAGSIGSELCRQVAQFEPRVLVAFDQAESELFKIDMELRNTFPHVRVVAEIGDIREAERVNEVIQQHGIESLYHAAAYKHVPLMEDHVVEAVKNNILGTWNVAEAARQNHVEDFLMISSDKAVNPTNVMGATKRIAELIVSRAPLAGKTKFVAVRFGNVLASNGSVVPVFEKQIAAGGPVTVTHPEVRRYFMTIREAVQLVLQASTMGKGSEVFVLDMGEPVKIIDMARNMIRLAGLVPDEEIEIRITGLRPGEKLYEELITSGENILPTYHEKIKIFRGEGAEPKRIDSWLSQLEAMVEVRDEERIVAHFKTLIPEYQPGSQWKIERHPPQAVTRQAAAAAS
jgi:FlaA1/EpsC-like NDP-sugar epimerase